MVDTTDDALTRAVTTVQTDCTFRGTHFRCNTTRLSPIIRCYAPVTSIQRCGCTSTSPPGSHTNTQGPGCNTCTVVYHGEADSNNICLPSQTRKSPPWAVRKTASLERVLSCKKRSMIRSMVIGTPHQTCIACRMSHGPYRLGKLFMWVQKRRAVVCYID